MTPSPLQFINGRQLLEFVFKEKPLAEGIQLGMLEKKRKKKKKKKKKKVK